VEGSDGRVVRHLLDNKVGAAAPILVRPVSIEDSGERKVWKSMTKAKKKQSITHSPRTGFRGLVSKYTISD